MSNHASSSEIVVKLDSDDKTTNSGIINNNPQQQPDHDDQKRCSAIIRCFNAFIKLLHYEPKGIESESDVKLRKEELTAYKKLMTFLHVRLVKPSFVVEVALLALLFVTLVALLATAGSVVQRKDISASRWKVFNLKIDRWVALVFVAVSGLPCIRLVTFIVSEPVIWFKKMNKYTLFFASKLKRDVDVTLWFTLLLWVWYNWFASEILGDTRGAKTLNIPRKEYENTLKIVTEQVTAMLLGVAIGALLWTLKDILYLKLKADLLINDVCPRIKRTLLDLHAIQFITDKGKWSFIQSNKNKSHNKKVAGVGANEDRLSENVSSEFISAVSYLKKENAPTWILERLIHEYMKYMKMKKTAYFLYLEEFHDDDKVMKLAEEMYSEILVPESGIDKSSVSPSDQKRYITVEDLRKHGRYHGEFKHVFELYKSCEDGKQEDLKIAQDEFYRWAIRALKNCLGFERTITGYEPIFRKLNVLLSSFVVMLTVVIWLLLSRLVTTGQLAILFAPFITTTFMFGDSLKTAFEGIVFVFGIHPFDLGDRVIIDDNRIMKVSEMNLLTTTFFVYDTGNEIIYPNADLAKKSIVNLDATKNMSDSVEFSLPVDTPEELMLDLQIRIKKTLDDEVTFTNDTMVEKKQICDEMNKVVILVHFKYLVAYHFETKTRATSNILNLIMRLRKEMEKVKQMERELESKQEQYEAITVKFTMNTEVKMKAIEELNQKLMGILQKYESSKNCSKVIFTNDKDAGKIYIAVHIRCNKTLLKSEGEIQSIGEEIESAIKAGQGSVIMNR